MELDRATATCTDAHKRCDMLADELSRMQQRLTDESAAAVALRQSESTLQSSSPRVATGGPKRRSARGCRVAGTRHRDPSSQLYPPSWQQNPLWQSSAMRSLSCVQRCRQQNVLWLRRSGCWTTSKPHTRAQDEQKRLTSLLTDTRDELTQARTHARDTETLLSESKSALAALQQQYTAASDRLQSALAESDALRAQLSDAVTRAAAADGTAQHTSALTVAAHAERDAIAAKLALAEQDAVAARAQCAAAVAEAAALQRALDRMERDASDQRSAAASALAEQERRAEAAVAAAQQQVQQASALADSLRSELDRMRSELSVAQRQCSEALALHANDTLRFAQAEQQWQADAAAQAAAVREQMDSLTRATNDLSAQVRAARSRHSRCSSKWTLHAAADTAQLELHRQTDAMEAERQAHRQTAELLQQQQSEAQRARGDWAAERARLQQQLSDCEDRIAREHASALAEKQSAEEARAQSSAVLRLSEEKESLLAQLTAATQQHEQLYAQNKKLHAYAQHLQRERDLLVAKRQQLDELATQQQQRLTHTQSELSIALHAVIRCSYKQTHSGDSWRTKRPRWLCCSSAWTNRTPTLLLPATV